MDQIPSNSRKIGKTVVVLPTFNEAASLPEVMNRILKLPLSLDILVVDDSSPDGTAILVKEHPEFGKRIFLKQRPRKMGLATAYKEGFQWGLENGYEVCMEMDSDLSHDPEDIPRLLQAIAEGADIALGSRYLHGISVINWPLRRLLVSIGAGIYTRLFSGLPLSDPTGGFKAIHRDVIEHLDWDSIKSDGYGFQIEVSFFARQKGFRIAEIPIIFTERRDGESKFSISIVWEAAIRVLQLGLIRFFPSWEKVNSIAIEKRKGDNYQSPYRNKLSEKKSEAS